MVAVSGRFGVKFLPTFDRKFCPWWKATISAPTPLYGSTASYRATIDWSDGTTSAGTITTNAQGGFNVNGTHTYAAARTGSMRVQVVHVLGNTTPGTATSTATVTSLSQGVTHGLTGTVAFWSGSNGQALINRFNGGSTATALANWLAMTFPNLYGAGAGGHNLTGKTNAQVAAFFLSLAQLPRPQVDADVLATALSVYATTRSLGGTVASAYGFRVSATGLGAHNYNVGSNGTAFGVANNTLLNVYELLQAANRQAVNGVLFGGNAMLRQEADNVFAGLLQAGRVP